MASAIEWSTSTSTDKMFDLCTINNILYMFSVNIHNEIGIHAMSHWNATEMFKKLLIGKVAVMLIINYHSSYAWT